MGVHLHAELTAIRSNSNDRYYTDILSGYNALLSQKNEGERVLTNLFHSEGNEETLDFNELDPSNIYHISDISSKESPTYL